MALINGYIFPSLEEGLVAMAQLNTYWGLPVPGGLSHFGEWSLETHPDVGIWCHASEWTTPLGEPVEITLPNPTI